jgi:hypothetical protein
MLYVGSKPYLNDTESRNQTTNIRVTMPETRRGDVMCVYLIISDLVGYVELIFTYPLDCCTRQQGASSSNLS